MGDRRQHLDTAVEALNALPETRVTAYAEPIETEPVGGPEGQGAFLNSACGLETRLAPEALLDELQRIEKDQGRNRGDSAVRWGPRTLDIDILLWGDMTCETARLTIPHPRMAERLFVLAPLAAIAPDALHPVLGLTARELLRRIETTT
jgi:2-amino-4-hydroxy-6-hydroxymethyldihydropteridine pyrophosphokinase